MIAVLSTWQARQPARQRAAPADRSPLAAFAGGVERERSAVLRLLEERRAYFGGADEQDIADAIDDLITDIAGADHWQNPR